MNKIVPEIFNTKMTAFIRYLKGISFFIIALGMTLSLMSFNLSDNSFLIQTDQRTQNLMGNFGSYLSSFIVYTFGVMGYFIPLFLFINVYLIFKKRDLNFLFIRLFILLVGLITLPQCFLFYNFQFIYLDNLGPWGTVSEIVFSNHKSKPLSYSLSAIGFLCILLSHLKSEDMKIFFNIFKNKKNNKSNFSKKDPLIRNKIKTRIEPDIINSNEKNISNDLQKYSAPSLDILNNLNADDQKKYDNNYKEKISDLLKKVFTDFNIQIEVINIKQGPVITLFEILPAAGTKINTIINLSDDISRSMGVQSARISQLLGTQYLGVEIPNNKREVVTIKELLSSNDFKQSSHKIPVCIGKDIGGKIEVIDLSKTPHLLIAGTTGSGKSVFVNTLICSLLYKFSPDELRLILIDPKMLELSVYNDIAHLLSPVVTEPKKSILVLKWVCKEMERRYSLMNEIGSRNIENFNKKNDEKLPFIVVVIDEMADLMMTAGKDLEYYVQRLAQMARACGIHLIMATQRPSVDIITGSIKANFPSRISFQVASKYDSRTVLGQVGAEQLLGNGDMLMSKNGSVLHRYQSAFISDEEVSRLIQQIKKNQKVKYLDELQSAVQNNDNEHSSLSDEDEILISQSIDLIKTTNKASTSFLQRNFQIGYNKAARIMEALEERGVVSEPNHAGKREILINNS